MTDGAVSISDTLPLSAMRTIGAAADASEPLGPAKLSAIRGALLFGAAAVTFGLGGFVAFAATAPVATAVVAAGIVAVESDRKKLQHLEGGVVRQIRVREGETVAQGDVLFRMAPLIAEVASGILDGQIAGAEALEARLAAERDGAPTPDFPRTLERDAAGRRLRADQERQFAERRDSLQGEIAIFETRIRQSDDQIAGFSRERDASVTQLRLIRSELVDIRKLFDRQLISRPRLRALEREEARLSGAIGLTEANIARIRNVIEESRREIARARQTFGEKVGDDLRTTRERLAELREKSRTARDVLERVEVRAPRAGVVQGLKVTTVGEVVQPGAVLLEIAPTEEALVVSGRVRPEDVDGLSPGMAASLRFTALPSRTTPVAPGALISVSRDRLVDPDTNEAYFLARVRLAEGGLAPELAARVTAGMPADVIVPTEDRTLLSYLLRPLSDALARGFRER